MSFEIASGACGVSESAWRVKPAAPGLHLPLNSRFFGGPQPSSRAAVFLDRDGVIVRDVHFLKTPLQIEFLKDVESLGPLMHRFYLVVVTNQSGIARKLLTEEDLTAIHSSLVLRLSSMKVIIDAFYYCPHLPTAELAKYRLDCDCRKPKPGMLLRAAREYDLELKYSYMIGDSGRDIVAGVAAGLAGTILVGTASENAEPSQHCSDLVQAVEYIQGGVT